MHDLWNMVRDGGGLAMLALFTGVIASLAGCVAALLLLFSKRAAFVLGIVTLVLAMGAASFGTMGVPMGRYRTDQALGGLGIDPSQAERLREQGYSESAAAGRVGAGAAFLPALLGALAAFLGAGGAPPSPPTPVYAGGPFAPAPLPPAGGSSKPRYVLAAIATALAVLALLAAFVGGMSAPYPNPHRTFSENEF
ncbi:MAG TPA: hypothetical protein VF316_19350 [Polyangiaceae bacterium]